MDIIDESSTQSNNDSKPNIKDSIKTFPAADAQKRLWFIKQLLPKSPVYNIYRAIRIQGVLDRDALLKTVNAMVARHEALRTTFDVQNGKVVQLVHPSLSLQMPFSDFSDQPENIENLLNKNIQEPFDLVRGPVVRVHLIKRAEKDHIFHFMVHHNAFDRRSLGLLNRELTEFYRHFTKGNEVNLPELPIQYSDYTLWRLDKHKTEDLSRNWKYWEKQLANVVPMSLPYDRQRSSDLNTDGDRIYLKLDTALVERFEAMAKQKGITMFIGLLSVFKTLIHRWSGETDILAGTPFADRRLKDSEDLFGFFVSTLVLRSDLSGDPTFMELLSRVRKTCFNSYRYNAMPLDTIIEKLNPARETNRNPLFDMEFQVQMLQPEALEIGDAILSEERAARKSSQYDLSMTIREKTDGYDMRFEYRSDLFERNTIELLLLRFHQLLEQIVEDPDKLISEYSIVLPEEENKLLYDWNKTSKPFETGVCLHQLFERQVDQSPDAVAIDFSGKTLTYSQLNKRANQLAHYLRSNGVTKEVRVGVCMERSLEMVIALYGILKAGGGYVPLDPDYPQERLTFMLEDIEAPIILTQQHIKSVIPESSSQVICLDADWKVISNESDDNPDLITNQDSLAYIIYTSGSTGNPKGVMNQHSGIINRLIWMQEEYKLTDKDVVLQKTPYSFDVSVWEFFWPLMFGAKMVVAEPGGHQDVEYLANLIHDKGISTLHFVPSMLQLFLDKADSSKCNSVRQVFCSGEALPYELQNQFFSFCKANLHNLYGPTEAAVDVTYWQCNPGYPRRIVPIGRPVANTKIYILDKHLKPIPVGSAGELHIGGVQVARGYLNRPDLTLEKFIADPYSKDPNAKLYKTGDLVRHLSDGQIEYQGRIDFQVKIRGLRIELGEIESRLAEIEGIKQCVVIVREDRPGDKKIVAYYEVKEGKEFTNEELRNLLGKGLPNYMVPQLFIKLDGLPLSPNGKIERKALPAPSSEDLESDNEFIAPQSEVEKNIAKVWEELLDVENVGVYDKFIELGGHSLLVLEAVWKAKKELNLELDPAALIRDTLEQIAASIEGENAVKRVISDEQKFINYKPFYFGYEKSLYGIYQWPTNKNRNRGAVLLCSPVYLESLNVHWAYRQLASMLADSGYHVIKFDYYGVGDSLGDDEEGDVQQWTSDIQAALSELRELSGHQSVSLVGFRFGATLAALTNCSDIDRIFLWEPIIKGDKYVEELFRKYHETLDELNYIRKKPAVAMDQEIIGYHLSDKANQSLSQADLLSSKTLQEANKVYVVTCNQEAEVFKYREKIEKVNMNVEFCIQKDSVHKIEDFMDLTVYLPGKSLAVIVDKMKETL